MVQVRSTQMHQVGSPVDDFLGMHIVEFAQASEFQELEQVQIGRRSGQAN